METFIFYKAVVHEAVAMTAAFLGFTSKASTFRTILLWALTTLLVYHLSNSSVLQARLEVGASSIVSVVLVTLTSFSVCLLLAPARLWKSEQSEKEVLKKVIDQARNIETQLQELSSLYYEGRELYDKGFHNEKEKGIWEDALESWKARVEERLSAGFSVSELHKFRQLHDFSRYTISSMEKRTISEEEGWLLSRYTAHLRNLDEIVQFSSSDFEASVKYAYDSARKP